MKNPLAIAIAAFALTTTVAGPALARPPMAGKVSVMTMDVSTAGLDLASAEGQQRLMNRVERAVRSVCRVTDLDSGQRLLTRDVRACLAKARASANGQVAALVNESRQRGG
jgi:UrcA family protein